MSQNSSPTSKRGAPPLTLRDNTDGHDLQTLLQTVRIVRSTGLSPSDALYDHADDVGDREDDREGLGGDGRVLRAVDQQGRGKTMTASND